ncbi:MAG: sugar porter (SP) family MFS transporter [Alphaproteobacteria bacterium]|jgi:sugar porter (SP) family MFS transporter
MKSQENIVLIILICCVATLGGFLFGFDSGVINGTIDGLKTAFNSQQVGTGFNVASMLLGCAIGAFFAGTLADKFGRRNLLLVAAMFFIVSAWGSGIASSSFEFIIFRVLGGLAVGAASVMTPAYISEIAPPRMRGRLATIQQFAIISGLLIAFISNYLLADAAGSSTTMFWMEYEAWRWMFWIELIPAVLFLLLLLLIPESPRFLVLVKREEEADKVLSRLFGKQASSQLIIDIKQSLESQTTPKLGDLIDKQTSNVRKIVWVGIGLAAFQQLVGINVIFYYGAILWQAVGFTEAEALTTNIIGAGISILACLITISMIDKIGRKPFLIIGSVGMTITLSLLVFAFGSAETNILTGNLDLGSKGTLALMSANAYVFFFNLSWGPVMWVMLGEMFPNQIRGSGLAVAGIAQWISNFAIAMTFPIMLSSIGLAGAYGFYAICALISVFFVVYFINETKGKTLESMPG